MASSKRKTVSATHQKIEKLHKRLDKLLGQIGEEDLEKEIREVLHAVQTANSELYGMVIGMKWPG